MVRFHIRRKPRDIALTESWPMLYLIYGISFFPYLRATMHSASASGEGSFPKRAVIDPKTLRIAKKKKKRNFIPTTKRGAFCLP